MIETVKEIICEYVDIEMDSISADSSLRYDIGATSFDLMNIAVAIEERFGIRVPDNALSKIKTVSDVAEILSFAK